MSPYPAFIHQLAQRLASWPASRESVRHHLSMLPGPPPPTDIIDAVLRALRTNGLLPLLDEEYGCDDLWIDDDLLHSMHTEVARALHQGRESQQRIAERIALTVGVGRPWMLDLAHRWLHHRRSAPPVTALWLLDYEPLNRWIEANPFAQPALLWSRDETARLRASVPPIQTTGELATWLGWSIDVLAGHADLQDRDRRAAKHRDYVYRWHGDRLIEAPKDRLKRGQRQILTDILEHAPVHDAAHGFVRGRSVHTHAALHVGRPWLVRFDLRTFFGTVRAARVHGLFRLLGYPSRVARMLTGLTTTWTPSDISRKPPWSMPHLPQGAPTSPLLANLIAWTLDQRLSGIAKHYGLTYSRYADDLTFSGDRPGPGFFTTVRHAVEQESFCLNDRKTRIRTQSQQQRVVGLVVNEVAAVPRRQRDRVRAVLHRAEQQGWNAVTLDGSTDPQASVRGQIAWIHAAHPRHGQRLLDRWEAIATRAEPD